MSKTVLLGFSSSNIYTHMCTIYYGLPLVDQLCDPKWDVSPCIMPLEWLVSPHCEVNTQT